MATQKTKITVTTEDLVSVPQAAKELGVNFSTAYRWIKKGIIRPFRIGGQVFVTKPSDKWQQAFRKYDVLATPVNKLSDLPNDPQVKANDYIIDWEHPVLGKIRFPGFPVNFTQTPATLRSPAPELGEHTEEVLVDLCGYSWEEVA